MSKQLVAYQLYLGQGHGSLLPRLSRVNTVGVVVGSHRGWVGISVLVAQLVVPPRLAGM